MRLSPGAACAWDSSCRRFCAPSCPGHCGGERDGSLYRSVCRKRGLSWELGLRSRGSGRRRRCGTRDSNVRTWLYKRSVSREAVDDAPLLQIVGGHLYLHPVTGKDAHAVHPHASCQMAEKFMILRLIAGHTDAECGVWETFFYNAHEFDYVLRHRELAGQEPTDPTDGFMHQQAAEM